MSWHDRDRLVKEYTVEVDGKLLLENDKTFSTPSAAAGFCLGRNSNGWLEWKDIDGKTLDDIYRKSL